MMKLFSKNSKRQESMQNVPQWISTLQSTKFKSLRNLISKQLEKSLVLEEVTWRQLLMNVENLVKHLMILWNFDWEVKVQDTKKVIWREKVMNHFIYASALSFTTSLQLQVLRQRSYSKESTKNMTTFVKRIDLMFQTLKSRKFWTFPQKQSTQVLLKTKVEFKRLFTNLRSPFSRSNIFQ